MEAGKERLSSAKTEHYIYFPELNYCYQLNLIDKMSWVFAQVIACTGRRTNRGTLEIILYLFYYIIIYTD